MTKLTVEKLATRTDQGKEYGPHLSMLPFIKASLTDQRRLDDEKFHKAIRGYTLEVCDEVENGFIHDFNTRVVGLRGGHFRNLIEDVRSFAPHVAARAKTIMDSKPLAESEKLVLVDHDEDEESTPLMPAPPAATAALPHLPAPGASYGAPSYGTWAPIPAPYGGGSSFGSFVPLPGQHFAHQPGQYGFPPYGGGGGGYGSSSYGGPPGPPGY